MSDQQPPEAKTKPQLRLVSEQDNLVQAAIHVLCERHQLTPVEAQDLLGRAGKHGTRDLYEVAADVVLIGVPDLVTPSAPAARPRPRPPSAGAPALAELVLDLLAECETLQDVLAGIAELAAAEIHGIDQASVTLIRNGGPVTVATSHNEALTVDETQYADGRGPCLHAASTDTLVQVDHVLDGTPIEAWLRMAAQLHVTAVASIPIPSTPHIAAALNLYSFRPGGGWDQETLDAAEILATYAGDAVTVAYRQFQPLQARRAD